MLAEAVEAGLGIFAGAVPATPSAVPPDPSRATARNGRPGAPDPGRARAGESGTQPDNQDHPAERNQPGQPPTAHQVAVRVMELWRRMGWPAARQPGVTGSLAAAVAAQVVITPACGLAGAPPEYARAALARCREAARLLPELIEEEAR